MAGDAIVIQNTIALPRVQSHIRYDGSDRIQASFPIAVTRGAYPARPGSVMAGAVEVFDTATWGRTFEAPVGVDVGKTFQAFELSMFFLMAAEDHTKVTLANGYIITLNQGQGTAISVNIGEQISSNKPIQVDLITGDRGSFYEMRVSFPFFLSRDTVLTFFACLHSGFRCFRWNSSRLHITLRVAIHSEKRRL
jgi:hypothetical protein